MKTYHIFTGDHLAQQLKDHFTEDEKIIWRECLIEGPVSEPYFFENRAQFLSENYSTDKDDYQIKVLTEFQKYQKIEENSTVYFWFEDDVFCQLNFWFLLSRIPNHENLNLYRIFPSDRMNWEGFSKIYDNEVSDLLSNSKLISKKDLVLGQELWKAFQSKNLMVLNRLSKAETEIFNKLDEIAMAIINLKSGKTQLELQLISEQFLDFESFFTYVQEVFGIYGFGDSQVKNLVKKWS